MRHHKLAGSCLSEKFVRVSSSVIILLISFLSLQQMAVYGQAQLSPDESVLTQHNDSARRGAYLYETQLKPENVNAASFGQLSEIKVHGRVLAQPLYVKGLPIGNILYVATMENRVYAYDVSDAKNPRLKWCMQVEVGSSCFDPESTDQNTLWVPGNATSLGAAPFYSENDDPPGYFQCHQTRGPVGIMSTPVIDLATNSMFVVYRTGLPPVQKAKNQAEYKMEAHFWLARLGAFRVIAGQAA